MGSEHVAVPFLTSALGGGEWLPLRPYCFTYRERVPSTHWIGGWVGPRDSLVTIEVEKNLLPLLGIEPWPSSP
jgi:hypothetical protein